MANPYFNWPTNLNRFLRFTTARAEGVNAALDQVSSGFDGLDLSFANSLRLAAGETSVPLPAASDRANKILSFDAIGNPVVSTAAAGSATDLAISLGAADGLSLIGGFVSYAALRAYAGSAARAAITGVLVTAAPQGIAGNFVRTTDTTSADNGGTIIVDALGRRWARQYTGTAYYDWFEPAGDNITDDAPAFNKAHASGVASLDFKTAKTYKLATPVQTYARQTVNNTPGALINFTGSNAYTPATDVTFNSLRFVGGRNNHAIAVPALTSSIQRVTINNPICDTCNLVRTIPAGGILWSAIDWDNKTNVAIDWTIRNPQGVTVLPSTAGQSFIDMEYIDGCRVYGGRAKGYYFGFLYWGGDSNFSVNGAVGNTRKCDNIFVHDFVADDCVNSGLWGSMGNKVRFINCQALRSTLGGDVGIDHEGTLDALNIGCTASNWNNGNFANFFGCKNVAWLGCTSYQRAGRPHWRNYNDSGDSRLGADVYFDGACRFVNTDGIAAGTAYIDALNGPFKSLTIDGCTLVDSIISVVNVNCGSIFIEKPRFQLTDTATSITVDLIVITESSSIREDFQINGVSVNYNNTNLNAASSLIRFISKSSNRRQSVRISQNQAWDLAIRVIEQGNNNGISCVAYIHDNMTSLVQTLDQSTAPVPAPMIKHIRDNYDQLGAAV